MECFSNDLQNHNMKQLVPWFTLKSVHGIGNLLFKRLILRFKSPSVVLEASKKDLLLVNGMSERLATSIQQHTIPEQVKIDIEQTLEKGFSIVTFSDSDYPALLREIPDPPPFLYVSGHLNNSIGMVAVVGSRNPTRYGLSITRQLCVELSRLEITIVSGMARGIDSAAHRGALLAKGQTIAVLGSGLNQIYPAENKKLFRQISENGAVVSEFSLNTKPEAYNFPARNRIISGVSLGTVVVEAARKSGSLITARLALEQNREVFAVPGSINSFKSAGSHTLIKQGAKLVENANDIIEEFPHLVKIQVKGNTPETDSKTTTSTKLSIEELPVYKVLGPYPVHIDDLVRNLEIDPGKLSGILLQLELKGIIQQFPGKLFSLSQ